jgi:hypothetical protein
VYLDWSLLLLQIKNSKKRILSKIFDSRYYLYLNEDVRAADLNPFDHWLTYGVTEGRKPNFFINLQKLHELIPIENPRDRILQYEINKKLWNFSISNYVSIDMYDLYKKSDEKISPILFFFQFFKFNNNFSSYIFNQYHKLQYPLVTNREKEIRYIADILGAKDLKN